MHRSWSSATGTPSELTRLEREGASKSARLTRPLAQAETTAYGLRSREAAHSQIKEVHTMPKTTFIRKPCTLEDVREGTKWIESRHEG